MEVSAPRKRARISTGPRKRTGCLSCKQSHVKCSETKPTCDRCLRTDAACVYPDPTALMRNRRKRDTSQVLFREPLTPTSPSSSLTLTLPTTRSLDDIGYHVLRYFHQRTVPMISFFVPATFWTQTLLQMSESIPAIKHCVLALGSWHLTVEKPESTASSLVIRPNRDALQFSAECYDKAISNLTNNITAPASSSSPVEVAVSASVLLAIYASLRGDRNQLITHVRLGLNLARESAVTNNLASVVEFNRRQLSLLRLEEEMRAPIFDSMSAEDTLADVMAETKIEDDDHTAISLDVLAASVQNMGNAAYRFARKCNIGVYAMDELGLVAERVRLEAQCNDLRAQMMNSCHTGSDARAFKILRARLELSWIMLQAAWTLLQTAFDQYTANFALILQLAEEVLRPANTLRQRLPFSVNLGLIPLLFYVSRLCRQPTLRRRAVELLDDCPIIEGLWNAREAAAVARFVIALEEDSEDEKANMDDPTISEDKRIHSLRFGASVIDITSAPSDMLDVTIMMRPEAAVVTLQESHYRICCEDWISGRGDLRDVIRL